MFVNFFSSFFTMERGGAPVFGQPEILRSEQLSNGYIGICEVGRGKKSSTRLSDYRVQWEPRGTDNQIRNPTVSCWGVNAETGESSDESLKLFLVTSGNLWFQLENLDPCLFLKDASEFKLVRRVFVV